MDEKTAKAILDISGELIEDGINEAYLSKIREYNDAGFLEEKIQSINMARDFLRENIRGKFALAPYLDKSLAQVSDGQARVAAVREAKEELSESFSAIERARVNSFRSSRDFAGIAAAISAALAFGRENFASIAPGLAEATYLETALLIMSASFAVFAFLSNRQANLASDQLKEANRKLTRSRAVSRILERTFNNENSLGEYVFEDRLVVAMKEEVFGSYRERISNIFDVYARIGFPIRPRFHLDENLVADYVDFLIKAAHVGVSGTSGTNMIFHRDPAPESPAMNLQSPRQSEDDTCANHGSPKSRSLGCFASTRLA